MVKFIHIQRTGWASLGARGHDGNSRICHAQRCPGNMKSVRAYPARARGDNTPPIQARLNCTINLTSLALVPYNSRPISRESKPRDSNFKLPASPAGRAGQVQSQFACGIAVTVIILG